jgi:hypothetical protein
LPPALFSEETDTSSTFPCVHKPLATAGVEMKLVEITSATMVLYMVALPEGNLTGDVFKLTPACALSKKVS